jgi:hypothetical protein
MVLVIAVLQALPVLLVGLLTRKQSLAWVAAGVMSLLAIATGSAAYLLADLFGIALALVVVYVLVDAEAVPTR